MLMPQKGLNLHTQLYGSWCEAFSLWFLIVFSMTKQTSFPSLLCHVAPLRNSNNNKKNLILCFFILFCIFNCNFTVVFIGVHIKQQQSLKMWTEHMEKKSHKNKLSLFTLSHGVCHESFQRISRCSQRFPLDLPKTFLIVLCTNLIGP